MKDQVGEDLERWMDRPAGGTAAEDRAADLLRGCLGPREPESARLARIGHALQRPRRRRAGSLVALRVALAVVSLVVGAATVKAYQLARQSGWFGPSRLAAQEDRGQKQRALAGRRETRREGSQANSSDLPAAPVAAVETPGLLVQPSAAAPPKMTIKSQPGAVASASRPPRARTAMMPPDTTSRAASGEEVAWVEAPGTRAAISSRPGVAQSTASPPDLKAPTSQPVSLPGVVTVRATGTTAREPTESRPAPVPVLASPQVVAPASPTVPSSSSASDEARALDGALGLLRREHNAAAALSALDVYLRTYPQGVLNREARFARIDALLLLGRATEALAALETLQLDRGRRATELRVIRGELRAAANCAGAETDFSTALGQSPNADLLGRILYGRGVCRSRLGDFDGTAADLQRYLVRFPDGPHASSARQWLQSMRSARPESGQ